MFFFTSWGQITPSPPQINPVVFIVTTYMCYVRVSLIARLSGGHVSDGEEEESLVSAVTNVPSQKGITW